jgi:hypothetical protein
MPARELTAAQIQAWKIAGRTPGRRSDLFNAEWESLCELALEALQLREELEILQAELTNLQNQS